MIANRRPKGIIPRLVNEFRIFQACSHSMRTLLITNMVYSLAMPILGMFIAAYIMRNSASASMVVTYQLASYTGIPFTFLINGFLLRFIAIKTLYAVGMLLSGISMTIMMALPMLNVIGVGIAGLVMGVSIGLYWANRDFLALESTTNDNRNYYFGLESFLGMMTGLSVPLAVGWFIEGFGRWSGNINRGYQAITVAVFAIAIAASSIIKRGVFLNPPRSRFVFFRFHSLWKSFLVLAVLKGLAQGYLVTAPAMLVSRFIGNEGALGSMQSAGVLFSAILLYFIGRFSLPKHRIFIFSAGLILFAVGGVANAVLFNSTGVFLFMLCLVLGSPLLDFAYGPIALHVVDTVAALEGRNQFAYILNHEFGLYSGRLCGCLLFIILANMVSDVVALRYALMVIGLLQMASIVVVRIVEKKSIAATDEGQNLPIETSAVENLPEICLE